MKSERVVELVHEFKFAERRGVVFARFGGAQLPLA